MLPPVIVCGATRTIDGEPGARALASGQGAPTSVPACAPEQARSSVEEARVLAVITSLSDSAPSATATAPGTIGCGSTGEATGATAPAVTLGGDGGAGVGSGAAAGTAGGGEALAGCSISDELACDAEAAGTGGAGSLAAGAAVAAGAGGSPQLDGVVVPPVAAPGVGFVGEGAVQGDGWATGLAGAVAAASALSGCAGALAGPPVASEEAAGGDDAVAPAASAGAGGSGLLGSTVGSG